MPLGSKLGRASWGRGLVFGEEAKAPRTSTLQHSPQRHAAADSGSMEILGVWCLSRIMPNHQSVSLPRSAHRVAAQLDTTLLVRERYHPYQPQVKSLCTRQLIAY